MQQKDLDKFNELAKQLIDIEKNIDTKKEEKSNLQRDIIVLKNGVATMHDEFNTTQKKYTDEIAHFEGVLVKQRNERETILNDFVAQKKCIENDRAVNERVRNELAQKDKQLSDREAVIVKNSKDIEKKLNIIKEVIELAKGL